MTNIPEHLINSKATWKFPGVTRLNWQKFNSLYVLDETRSARIAGYVAGLAEAYPETQVRYAGKPSCAGPSVASWNRKGSALTWSPGGSFLPP